MAKNVGKISLAAMMVELYCAGNSEVTTSCFCVIIEMFPGDQRIQIHVYEA